MELTVKVNVDTDEAIEKLERIKELCKEINDLQGNRPNINVNVKNETDLPAIKSYINNENAKNADFSLLQLTLNCVGYFLCPKYAQGVKRCNLNGG